jgi:hypothetical protein
MILEGLPHEHRTVWLQARSAEDETAVEMSKRLGLDEVREVRGSCQHPITRHYRGCIAVDG